MIDDNRRNNDAEDIFFEENDLVDGGGKSFFEDEHHQGHHHNTSQKNGSDGSFFASMVDDALGAKKRTRPQKDKRKSRKGGGLGLVLTLAALGAGGYFWATSDKQTVEKIVQDVTAKLEEQGAMDKLRTLKNSLAVPELENKEQKGDAQEKDDYLPFEDVASTEQVDQERMKQPEQNVASEKEAGASNAESDGAVTEQFPLAEEEDVAEDLADLVLPGEQKNQAIIDKQNAVSEDKDSERDIEHLLKAQAENYEKALSALKAEIESYRSELSLLKEMMSKLKNSNALQDGHPKQDVKVQEIYEELDKINIKLSQLGNVEKKVADLSKHLEDIEKSTKILATRKHVDHKLNIYDKKIKRWVSKRFVKKAEEYSVAHVKKQAHSEKQTAEHVTSKKQVKTKSSAPKGIHIKKYGENDVIVIGNDIHPESESIPSFRGHAEIISLDPYKKEAVIIVDNGKIIEVKEGKYEPLLKAKILKVSEGGIVTTRGLISR